MLAFGFLVALGVLGLDLSKVSVLAGAFGVGIGFGLQDVVNNFELRAWTDRFDNWGLVRSELASAVYDAVYAAGMSFPFPQREVRVLGEPAAEKSVAPQPDGGTEPEQKR